MQSWYTISDCVVRPGVIHTFQSEIVNDEKPENMVKGQWDPLICPCWWCKLRNYFQNEHISVCWAKEVPKTLLCIPWLAPLSSWYGRLQHQASTISRACTVCDPSSGHWRLQSRHQSPRVSAEERRFTLFVGPLKQFMKHSHQAMSAHISLGLYSLSGKTSYRQISWSLGAARLDVAMVVSLWNLTGTSAAALPRYLPNFGAIGKI